MRRHVKTIVALTIIGILALAPAATQAAPSSVNHATYQFFVGVSPAQFPGVVMGPAVAMAQDGSTVTITGQGTFNAGPDKSVSGGGDYMIQDASGATVASGIWSATQMLGFVNYGSGTPQGTPPNFYGGQAQMKVSLNGLGGGLLDINCTLGDPPQGHNGFGLTPDNDPNEEGIDLRVGTGLTFNREVNGETLFVNPAQ
jgi:hypothetical protein